jgi:hypothetical protein
MLERGEDMAIKYGKRVGDELTRIFEERSPVLVEVRFRGCGTSPDWYLFEEKEDLDDLLARLTGRIEVHVISTWDLEHPTDKVIKLGGSRLL